MRGPDQWSDMVVLVPEWEISTWRELEWKILTWWKLEWEINMASIGVGNNVFPDCFKGFLIRVVIHIANLVTPSRNTTCSLKKLSCSLWTRPSLLTISTSCSVQPMLWGKGFEGLCYGSSLFLMDLSTEDFFNAIPLKLAKSLCYFRGRQRQWINMPEGICVKI